MWNSFALHKLKFPEQQFSFAFKMTLDQPWFIKGRNSEKL